MMINHLKLLDYWNHSNSVIDQLIITLPQSVWGMSWKTHNHEEEHEHDQDAMNINMTIEKLLLC